MSRKVERLVAAALVATAVALVARSVAVAGQVHLENPRRLVTTGPYAFSRNPMYVGWALLHLGVGIGAGSVWIALTLPAAVTWIHREITREERWLAATFAEEFAAYRATVPRYVPHPAVLRIRRRHLRSVPWARARSDVAGEGSGPRG